MQQVSSTAVRDHGKLGAEPLNMSGFKLEI
jgi:hypothetical protein